MTLFIVDVIFWAKFFFDLHILCGFFTKISSSIKKKWVYHKFIHCIRASCTSCFLKFVSESTFVPALGFVPSVSQSIFCLFRSSCFMCLRKRANGIFKYRRLDELVLGKQPCPIGPKQD